MWDFILEKGDKATTLKEVNQILHRIDHANTHMKQATEKLSKMKVKEGKEEKTTQEKGIEKGGTNMCQLKNHKHTWNKCPNNPISKNISGKSYTEIPASERCENDFAKNAKTLAKEEKETKKKGSIKNGESLIMAITPMVTIKEKKGKFKELEYDSDDDYLED
jgi:hypothetical protein